MPMCGGSTMATDPRDLSRCYCESEEHAAREGARRLAENHRDKMPQALVTGLMAFAETPPPSHGSLRKAGRKDGRS